MRKVKSKHTVLMILAGISGILLVTRLFMLTVLQHEKWDEYVDDISVRAVYETAPRGDILDRNGKVLAGSRAIYSVKLNRTHLTSDKALEASYKVRDILLSEGEDIKITQEKFKSILVKEGYEAFLPVELADRISAETAAIIKESAIEGVEIYKDYVRYYPYGAVASHVIGYIGKVSQEELKTSSVYNEQSFSGKDGIEKVMEKRLRGTDTIRRFQIDASGNVYKTLDTVVGKKGKDVKLTLDIELQKTAENALEQAITAASDGGVFESDYGACNMIYADKAASGAAVAVKIGTGEVLAMASYPDYDPNDFAEGISQENWQKLQPENPYDPMSPSPMYNLAAMSAVQPGSTFKPVTAIAALKNGVGRHTSVYDAGVMKIGGMSYGCHLWNENGASHGAVDLREALKVSCNYYFYDLVCNKGISNESILAVASNLGLGSKTGVEINEAEGTLPSEDVKLQSIKSNLRNYLLRESEYYICENALKNRSETRKNIEKIVNWADNDLTLNEIIGKLKSTDFVKEDKITELAEYCKYNYFDQVKWTEGDALNISIGQGDNAYTPLQMASYMAALGNGGIRTPLFLIEKSKENQNYNPIANENDVKYILECLCSVTGEPGGTLESVFAGFPYRVAAKTGTAQKSGYIKMQSEREYIRRHLHLIAPGVLYDDVLEEAARLVNKFPDVYEEDAAIRKAVINLSNNTVSYDDLDIYKEEYDNFAWTVALAPAEKPEIAVAVMIVQGGSSYNAAPAVREIIGKYGEITGWQKLF